MDGFGNRLQQNVTKGSAPTQSLLVSGVTNRITTSGFTYDANGNMTANPQVPNMIYDTANRLIESYTGSNTSKYTYDHANKRVYRFPNSSSQSEFYFYGWNGELMGAYRKITITAWEQKWTNVSFAGRLIQAQSNWVVTDRLGSVRWRSNSQGGSTTFAYYPYGDPASPSSTNQSENRFATYVRDLQTGLDYADQRYHTAAYGRFLTPDPYQASAGPADPASWNRYAYVQGDPVNFYDPKGLFAQAPHGELPSGPYYGGGGGGGGSDRHAQLEIPPDFDYGAQSASQSATPTASSGASFVAAANALFRASDLLIGRIAQNRLPDNCVKLLAAAGLSDLGQLRSAARNMQVWDGTTESTFRVSSLYPEPARSSLINSGKDRTIAEAFAAGGGTITAMAQLGGNLIFIDGARIDPGNQESVGALLIHELLHNITSQTDDGLATSFGISEKQLREHGTIAITNKIKDRCF